MHYKKVKSILSTKDRMNLYRGCTHGCIYCDSRSTCYQIKHEFEDVEIKENAIELLENTLFKKRKKSMIEMGSMTDPYLPIEKTVCHTRQALETIYKHGFGVSLITKSDLILRDVDILKKINERSKCVVQITITTIDDSLCKIIEPNVAITSKRMKVLEIMQKENIPTVVWLTPILPYINDTEENITRIIDKCIEYGVKGIMCFNIGLTLREGNREYFYSQLDKNFPGLKQKYINMYGNNYIIESKNNQKLMNIFIKKCRENNIMYDTNQIFEYLHHMEEKEKQLSLF
ncbi:MAG: radical SAM protein [Bacilli bacterium]